jgi:hypothetical protein
MLQGHPRTQPGLFFSSAGSLVLLGGLNQGTPEALIDLISIFSDHLL